MSGIQISDIGGQRGCLSEGRQTSISTHAKNLNKGKAVQDIGCAVANDCEPCRRQQRRSSGQPWKASSVIHAKRAVICFPPKNLLVFIGRNNRRGQVVGRKLITRPTSQRVATSISWSQPANHGSAMGVCSITDTMPMYHPWPPRPHRRRPQSLCERLCVTLMATKKQAWTNPNLPKARADKSNVLAHAMRRTMPMRPANSNTRVREQQPSSHVEIQRYTLTTY